MRDALAAATRRARLALHRQRLVRRRRLVAKARGKFTGAYTDKPRFSLLVQFFNQRARVQHITTRLGPCASRDEIDRPRGRELGRVP